MHITMIDAVSLNGKITKGSSPNTHDWTSDEDFAEFVRLRDAHTVLIMGFTTYKAAHPKPDAQTLRIVLTRHPEVNQAVAVPGQLEFITATPEELVGRLQKEGHDKALLLGGGQVNSQFLASGLVDDMYLTFEPVIFGTGTPFVAEQEFNAALQLESVRQLNSRGTLFAHYTIVKS